MDEQIQIKPKKNKLVLFLSLALAICIIAIGGYLALDQYNNQINLAQQEAYNLGAIDAIRYITSEASQCKQVPINISENLITLFAVECLQQTQ